MKSYGEEHNSSQSFRRSYKGLRKWGMDWTHTQEANIQHRSPCTDLEPELTWAQAEKTAQSWVRWRRVIDGLKTLYAPLRVKGLNKQVSHKVLNLGHTVNVESLQKIGRISEAEVHSKFKSILFKTIISPIFIRERNTHAHNKYSRCN